MRSFVTLFFAGLASVVVAQNSTSGNYHINPASVDDVTRASWCYSQIAACPLICLQIPGNTGNAKDNTCDPDTLDFSCVCSSGISPNASEFSETLPYFICTEWGNQCVTACKGESLCSAACRDDHPCGAQSTPHYNTTTTASSSTMAKTATSSVDSTATATSTAGQTVYHGFGDDAASQTGAAAPLELGQSYGFMVFAASFLGGFALFF